MVYYDIIEQQKDARFHEENFLLWKKQWDAYTVPQISLNWKCVKFEQSNKNQIPIQKGVYAFFVEPRLAKFPSTAYLVYIGQAGFRSDRHLRKRFGDYLQDKKTPKRPKIHLMLNKWENYLYFYYAEVDATQTNLKQLEQKLLDTFTPPFSQIGYSAKIGKIIKGLK